MLLCKADASLPTITMLKQTSSRGDAKFTVMDQY